MNKNIFLYGFFFFSLLFLFFSCRTLHGPNEPYTGIYPESLKALSRSNNFLATEIARLPEIRDGISIQEENALDLLWKVYNENKIRFDSDLAKMNQVGKPAFRAFCTPIQALFWLAEDKKKDALKAQITEYKLNTLLLASWDFKTKFEIESVSLTEDKANEILNAVDPKIIWYRKNHKSARKTLVYCYNRTPGAIPEKFKKEIDDLPDVKAALRYYRRNQKRWSDVEAIIDRLNDPRLLNTYINKNIRYFSSRPGYHQPISLTIKLKSGDCDDLAYMGKIVLARAGYKVFGRRVGGCTRGTSCHIGLAVKNEDGTYLLAVNFRTLNSMTGPYTDLLELDKTLGYGSGYPDRGPFSFNW